jgi:hypothetical protein
MIVVRLMGGLGNQMFQYALGCRLAHDRSAPLKVDLSWFREAPNIAGDTVREFALDKWNVNALEATVADLARFPLSSSLSHRIARRIPLFSRRVITERTFGFDCGVFSAPSTAYLRGYWQSPKYFGDIDSILRADFTMKAPPCSHATDFQEEAAKVGAVSLHIRRGDYVLNPETNAFHGICTTEYYEQAAALVAERIEAPRFLVFTDDPAWAKKNLKLDWPTVFVEHRPSCLPHNDIWLMSLCSHHIIANSSFSWWGAWLGTNPQKMVIAPAQWFRNEDIDTTDLFPEGWIRL